jgi:hypothetical protein
MSSLCLSHLFSLFILSSVLTRTSQVSAIEIATLRSASTSMKTFQSMPPTGTATFDATSIDPTTACKRDNLQLT